jgi:hypothetical protein
LSKKWYNYFVITESDGSTSPATLEPPAKRVEDVVPAAPVDLPAGTSVSGADTMADVYAAARIEAPAHGYSVLKVAEMLESEHIRTLPPDVRRKSVLVALEAARVPVDDIIQDAVRRDRALDTYERVLEQHLDQVRSARAADNARLDEEVQARIAELRARIEANTEEIRREEASVQAWRARKQQEEATIAQAVGYFVTENPITTVPPTVTGDADVR